MPGTMLKAERQQKILHLIDENEHVTVPVLSQSFQVSEATVRRDLEELSQTGHVRRAYGGALRAEPAPPEPPILQRTVEYDAEKQRIGLAAADLIRDGETIFIGSGSTTAKLAHALVGKRHLTVITNALNIAFALARDADIDVVMLGGVLRRSELSTIGHLAEQVIGELRADKVVMGAHALDPHHGITSEYLPEVMTDRAIMKLGAQLVIVADHSKFGKVSTGLIAPIQSVHTIVTDSVAPQNIVCELEKCGVHIVLA